MPLFDFECMDCKTVFEKDHPRGTETPPCPACKSIRTEKRLSPPPIIFKGGGFYKTDSGSGIKKAAGEPPKAEPESGLKKTDENASTAPKTIDPSSQRKE